MLKILNILYSYSKVPSRLISSLGAIKEEWEEINRQEEKKVVSLMCVRPTMDGQKWEIVAIDVDPKSVSSVMDDSVALRNLKEGKLPDGLLGETRFVRIQIGGQSHTVVGTRESINQKLFHSKRILQG